MTDFDAQPITVSSASADTAAAAAVAPPSRWLRRGLIGASAIAAVALGGMALNRGDKAKVQMVAPPEPVSSEAPVVDDVITRLEARLKEEPEDADAWRKLGWSHFQAGQYAEAASALRKANHIDPTHAETYSFLGEALVLASKREGRMPRSARAAFEKALKLNPKDARARYFHALALDLNGQHRRAINTWFEQLKETPPDAPYAEDIRKVIRDVGARHHIEVEKRLAEVQFVPPAPQPPLTQQAAANQPGKGKAAAANPREATGDGGKPAAKAAAPAAK